MADVFVAIKEIVKKHIVKEEPRKLTIQNASGRTVMAATLQNSENSYREGDTRRNPTSRSRNH